MKLARQFENSRLTVWGLAVLLSAAFLLRLWGVERYGLWIDEIVTGDCMRYTLATLLDCQWIHMQSPLHHYATKVLYTGVGRPALPAPDWLVRLPEVLAGTAAVGAAWLAARELFGTRGAWLNAVLWTLAPTPIAYSQEARGYAWLLFLSNLGTWLLVVSLRRRLVWGWVAFGIVSALSFYSHYLGAFIFAAQLGFALLYLARQKWRGATGMRRDLMYLGIAMSCYVVLILPWMKNTLEQFVFLVQSPYYTRIPLTAAYLADAQTWLVLSAANQTTLAYLLSAFEIIGIVWMAKRAHLALAMCACWLGFVTLFLAYRQGGFAAFRYWLVVQAPALWMLTAAGLAIADGLEYILNTRGIHLRPRIVTTIVALLAVALMLPATARAHDNPLA